MTSNFSRYLSVVVVTKDNAEELVDTLVSIERYCCENCEVIIINSGAEESVYKIIEQSEIRVKHDCNYFFQEPSGVFPAQNYGIAKANGEWVMVLNSGDMLSENARYILRQEYLEQWSLSNILVFSQLTLRNGQLAYRFTPTKTSIWPHQSVLVKKSVYDENGFYREDFKYAAEQFYFATLRKHIRYQLIDKDLTIYKLGGLSSSVNYQFSKELFAVWRELGTGVLQAFSKSFLLPYIRKVLLLMFSPTVVERIRVLTFQRYDKQV